jgi:hypothetical protein
MNIKKKFFAMLVILCYSQFTLGGIITGPALTNTNTGWANNGLSFTALQDSTLTSFVYNNQGLADTILLVDELGSILQSVNLVGGDTQQLINVSWSLLVGEIYGLLATQEFGDNGKWVDAFFPVSNADISVNGFADNGLGSVAGTDYWFHFNEITTTTNAVPEPSTLAIFTLGIIGLASRRFKKQS